MSILFEYGHPARTSRSNELRHFLRGIWESRKDEVPEEEAPAEETDSRYQPFLRFDGDEIRANNYIGFIQNGEELIEIYPKVFRHLPEPESNRSLMLRHIFLWFDYCRKWKFPFATANLDPTEFDVLPELIINLIAKQFFEAVSSNPFHLYQELEESLRTPRGSINFKRYISNGFATGNLHFIECDHEPFLYDNRVNRVIKHCTRLLLARTRIAETARTLQDVIFILDEVSDTQCTIHDVESISINPFFEDYEESLGLCRMILQNQLYSSNANELEQWCLLFPMEYIFEDFLAGFISDKFSTAWKVEFQKSELSVVDKPEKIFQMQHDIFLTSKSDSERKIIIDTKYKLREGDFKKDLKKGIAQGDLYQMVSYAFKRGCTDLLLIYPNISEELNGNDTFVINSGFDIDCQLRLIAIEVPFWSIENFENIENKLTLELDRHLSTYSETVRTLGE